MANFKTYLQSYSSPITIFENGSADAWKVFTTYIPPADGFVVLTCTSANNIGDGGSYLLVDLNATPTSLIVPQSGKYTTSTMVRKGETARFAGDNVVNASAKFIPSYGNT